MLCPVVSGFGRTIPVQPRGDVRSCECNVSQSKRAALHNTDEARKKEAGEKIEGCNIVWLPFLVYMKSTEHACNARVHDRDVWVS